MLGTGQLLAVIRESRMEKGAPPMLASRLGAAKRTSADELALPLDRSRPGGRGGRSGSPTTAESRGAQPAVAARARRDVAQRAGTGALSALGGGPSPLRYLPTGAVASGGTVQTGYPQSERAESDQPALCRFSHRPAGYEHRGRRRARRYESPAGGPPER